MLDLVRKSARRKLREISQFLGGRDKSYGFTARCRRRKSMGDELIAYDGFNQ